MEDSSMPIAIRRLFLSVALVAVSSTLTLAQGTATSSLTGTVVDSAAGVIPGATVVVTDKATGTKFNAVTDSTGTFTVPSLPPAVYSVSVSLMGFKTAVVDEVRLQPSIPASVKAVLEVGSLEETVLVEGGAHLVNTQT